MSGVFWLYWGLNSRPWAGKQAPYHLNHAPSPFCLVKLSNWVSGWSGPRFSYLCFPCTWDCRHAPTHLAFVSWDDPATAEPERGFPTIYQACCIAALLKLLAFFSSSKLRTAKTDFPQKSNLSQNPKADSSCFTSWMPEWHFLHPIPVFYKDQQ
jgi:hypothetical protein